MESKKKLNVNDFRKMKKSGEKIVMLTSYDAPTARVAYESGVEMLLVGDTLAMTVLGYENTLPLTLDQSLYHCAAVRRGAPNAFIVGDMPFMTYQADPCEAMKNAARYLQEPGVDAVKLEGGLEMAPLIKRFTGAGIPVVAHIGLLPQQVMAMGGYKVAGKTEEGAKKLMQDAIAVQEAGAFCVVVESVPATLGAEITKALDIPTIGIGAGVHCDGQVQVVSDLLGMFTYFKPRHTKRYAELAELMNKALGEYVSEVKSSVFPGPENSF
jgi:3-methyl-2-oxobutanoate hydroxymethyltransferase